MITIRPVTKADHVAISVLIVAAFRQPNEANLVKELRDNGEVAIELLAETEEGIVGHICLTRLQVPKNWLTLAPVSVRPENQGQGFGKELIRHALDQARQQKYASVVVVGDPGYYKKFGFVFGGNVQLNSPYPQQYSGLYPIDTSTAKSNVTLVYPEAFERV